MCRCGLCVFLCVPDTPAHVAEKLRRGGEEEEVEGKKNKNKNKNDNFNRG